MKKILLTLALVLTTSAFPCWYSKTCYTDYIYSINGQTIHSETKDGETVQYMHKNNIVVDFPITVTVKLVSDQTIDVGG